METNAVNTVPTEEFPFGGALPPKGCRIVVAMSGGVDSSVTAAWLKHLGYDVIGISLQLHDMAEDVDNKFGTCCSLSDISDARRVAETMGIPFYVANMETEFNQAVIDDFVHEYLKGRTPNPCVKCNEKVKFSRLMDWAMDLGADYLATGHYANIRYNPENKTHELCKGKDDGKDQSYFLFTLQQKDLSKTLFPIGNLEKDQVREIARRLGLAVANKPDSQEICFVKAKSYKDFIEEKVPPALIKKGEIKDTEGKVIGQHDGLYQFTLGQRKGIGVNSNVPLFVVELDDETNTVVVGPETALFRGECLVTHVNWVSPPMLDTPQNFSAKIRYRAKESPVEITPLPDQQLWIRFKFPQRAITPGQSLVIYRDDQVVGGGWIQEVK